MQYEASLLLRLLSLHCGRLRLKYKTRGIEAFSCQAMKEQAIDGRKSVGYRGNAECMIAAGIERQSGYLLLGIKTKWTAKSSRVTLTPLRPAKSYFLNNRSVKTKLRIGAESWIGLEIVFHLYTVLVITFLPFNPRMPHRSTYSSKTVQSGIMPTRPIYPSGRTK